MRGFSDGRLLRGVELASERGQQLVCGLAQLAWFYTEPPPDEVDQIGPPGDELGFGIADHGRLPT